MIGRAAAALPVAPRPLALYAPLVSALLEQLPPVLSGGAVYAAYSGRCRTLARRGAPVPRTRQAAFAAGTLVCVAATVPPLSSIDDELLVAHMGQHVLLGDIGPLLIVLGLTGPLLAPLLRHRSIAALRRLSHPVVAYLLWAADLYIWHIPIFYQAAVRHDAVHALEHLLFTACAINMWLALLGPLPKPGWFGTAGRLLYIVGVRLTGTVLGNAFLWSGVLFYPVYRSRVAAWGFSPLEDQSLAGALMMVEESIVTLGLLAWVFLRAARESDERQELLEHAQRLGVPLSEERAARAVASGRADLLRERLDAGGTGARDLLRERLDAGGTEARG